MLAVLAVLALFGAGCSGINTSQSVSPLDFFLPGIGHFIKVEPPPTNAPVVFRASSIEVASVK